MFENIFAVLFSVIVFVSFAVALWKIVKKTGSSGIASILFYIPFVNVIYIFLLAYSKWPIEKELEQYREKYGPLEEELDDNELLKCPNCLTPIPDGAEKCVVCGFIYRHSDTI